MTSALCLCLLETGGFGGKINWQSIQSGQNKGRLNPGGKDQEGFSSLIQEVCSRGTWRLIDTLNNFKKDTEAEVVVKAVLRRAEGKFFGAHGWFCCAALPSSVFWCSLPEHVPCLLGLVSFGGI